MQLQTLLTASLLLLLFWKKDGISSAAEPGYLDFDNLPETNFSCESKVIGGYYADVETGCQMFHVCTIGQKGEITDIKFLCLNGTVFDQETRVCERLDEVDCSKTESFFDLNLQLYGNKAGPFGIEPENEEIVEEECDPEDEEECQRTEDGGVREDDEEGTGGGGPGGEKVPLINNNNGGAIQQTTFPPISVATTTTNRPNVFSSTSTARVPTSTLQPSTTGQPAFQSGDPDTIAALLALHNAFAQSLQHHDINNKQQQEQQQAQQQEQIEQQQRDIQEHQRKQHLQQIQQQKQQEQLQHQQAQLQQHQAQLDQRQQKITQQAAKQAANAYVAAVESQAPHAATAKPVPPPPQVPQQNLRLQQVAQQNLRSQQQVLQGVLQQQNLRPQQVSQQQVLQQQSLRPQQVPQQQQNLRLQQAAQQNLRSQQTAQQQVLQGVLQQGLQEVRQQQPTHRFPGQIHYDTSKQQNPVLPSQQEQQQKLLQQQQHRFPQQQVHYETSTSPQQDSPQRFPHYNSKPESNPRFPAQIHFEATKSPVIGAERFGGGSYVAEATKSPVISAERFGGGAYGSEATKSPVIGAERFGGGAYQQNFGQQRGQSGERPKPFSFHQYDSQPSTTASPYLLHQLKVNRVKQEQQHSNFPRQASQRSITTPAVAVVTSTSTTTSIRSGATKKGQLHTGNDNLGPLHISNEGPLHTRSETFLGSSVTSSSSELLPGNNETAHAQSAEYEDYQEGDVGADPFFQDVPKIGRNRRDVEGVVRDSRIQEGATFGGEVARVKGSVRDSEKEKGATSSGGVAGVKGSIRDSEKENGATSSGGVAGVNGVCEE
uniref:Cuticular protein n=1 Tax=Nilaparvata lugens TaxID=108931 RepID=A0A2S1ZS25_NILLU|nr:cuticular protein [Nilaparvata lugens]